MNILNDAQEIPDTKAETHICRFIQERSRATARTFVALLSMVYIVGQS